MNDTRKDKRAPVTLKVRFKSATVDEFVEHYSRDISQGGLFIKSKQPMAIGTLLKFELQLKDESRLIQGVGRVVWKREATEATTDDAPSGMGIKFIKMDPESRSLVDSIVSQRGEAPGQYEAGGGDAAKDEEPEAPAAPRAVKSAKPTMQFFPAAGPNPEDLPKPEDRTQIRQASEFLAAALADVGGGASKEAEENAEAARRRTEEIEREREAAAAREKAEAEAQAKAAKEARDRADKERAEAEKKAADKKADEEKKAADKKADEEKKAADKKADEEKKAADKKAGEEKKAADKKAGEEKKAADKKAGAKKDEATSKKDEATSKKDEATSKKDAPATAVARPTTEVDAPAESTNLLPLFLVILLVAAGGIYMLSRGGTATEPSSSTHSTNPTETAPTPPEPEPAAPPTPVEAPPPDEPTPVEPTPVEPTGGPPTTAAPSDAVPARELRITTRPAGAEVLVNGNVVGTSPITTTASGVVEVTARLAGYREGRASVLADATTASVTLETMPYVIDVQTTPPGATVRVGGQTVTAPARIEVPRPTSPVRLSATLAGHASSSTTLEPGAFTAAGDAMQATATLTLAPAPTTPRPARPRPRPPEASMETSMAAEPIPDNPF